MEANQPPLTNKNIFSLPLRKDEPPITISSQFDSGNMLRAEIGLNNALIITPANDCTSFQTMSHAKGWFHFSVSGVPLHTKVKFIVKRCSPLGSQLKFSDYFRPVYRAAGEDWNRVEQAIVFDDTQLHFEFIFPKNSEFFFAYTFPFSYQQCEKMLRNAQKQAKLIKSIYYKDEIMIKTTQGRSVHLLTVTSNDDRQDCKEEKLSEYMFNYGERCLQFKRTKRVVIVSARVHPGQTPSSHTFNGLLKFLLSNDARAYYLRKNFVFKLVPMLNPDGVYQGHYRMDVFGQNLNRFYINPDVEKQPAVFAVKKLGQHYHKQQNLCFYIDLHAHPQRKGNFIYGNSMEIPQEQVDTQLFARILSLNCIEFDYFNSSFSKYHMNAKDKNEDLTKQGCGRVVFNTHFQMPYTYTMECGYTSSVYLNQICPIQNNHRKFQKYSINSDELQNIKSSYYNGRKSIYFSIRSYENLGKNILVSILDLFELNPASRIPNTAMKNLAGIRQQIMEHINKASMTYNNKLIRSPATQGNIKPLRPGLINQKMVRKYLIRAPSIESSKQICFNKLRNKTITKVNIGGGL